MGVITPYQTGIAPETEDPEAHARECVQNMASAALATASYIGITWLILIANRAIAVPYVTHILVILLGCVPWILLIKYANARFAPYIPPKSACITVTRAPCCLLGVAIGWTTFLALQIPAFWIAILPGTAALCAVISYGCVTCYTIWVDHYNARH